MKMWDAETGKGVACFGVQSDWAQALAFSPDGRRLAVGRYDGSSACSTRRPGDRVLDPLANDKVAGR